jgi:hypothetical protein
MTRTSVLLALCLIAPTACGGDTRPPSDGTDAGTLTGRDGGSPSTVDAGPRPEDPTCASVCADRLDECGAPPGTDLCSVICDELTTRAEIACLESSSCGELEEAIFEDRVPCAGTEPPLDDDAGPDRPDTDGGTTSAECDPPFCDGNRLTTCEIVGGVEVVSTMTCSVGCEDGACTDAPSELTIDANFGSADPIHVMSGDDIVSFVSLVGTPEFSPEAPTLPDLRAGEVTIESPAPGLCAASASLTLNRSQIGVNLEGTDRLPSTACVEFSELAVSGITLVVRDAPWGFPLTGTVDVTIHLRP